MQQALYSIQNVAFAEHEPILAVLVGQYDILDEAQILAEAFATRATLVHELDNKSLGELEFSPILLLLVGVRVVRQDLVSVGVVAARR